MKLAFVSARYGAEITHGPEHACRLLAEQMSLRHDVDVLTTSARSEGLWRNEYPEGLDRIRGVLVRRFNTGTEGHAGLSSSITARRLAGGAHSRADEDDWVAQQGPASPGLVEFLARQHRSYDAIAFFSCRHATTIQGSAVAPDRTVLFPWLSVDPALRLAAVRRTLAAASTIGLMSAAERPLLEAFGGRTASDEDIVGIGIEPPPQFAYPRIQQEQSHEGEDGETEPDAAATDDEWAKPHLTGRGMPFRRRHRLDGRLAVYAGVTGPGRGCEEMLEYFDSYTNAGGVGELVLLGVKLMKIPSSPSLRLAGVLAPRDRMAAYEAADVTIAPGGDDLTSESVLESFAAGTPVLASAANPAAVDHCRRSGGGLYYANREEFAEALAMLMADDALRTKLGENGQRYVRQQFKWEATVGRLERLLTKVRPR